MRRKSVLCTLFVVAVVVHPVGACLGGWNPIKTIEKVGNSISDALTGAGRKAGEILGAPAGGFVDSATAPTVRRIENAGHRIVADVDTRLGTRLKEIDEKLNNRIKQVDNCMEARIFQLTSGVDAILDESLLRAERISNEALTRLDKIAEKQIQNIDGKLEERITQVDEILRSRIDQIDTVLANTIADVDQRLGEHISQLDEIAETRIGNFDVVATKTETAFESGLLRVILLGSIVVVGAFLAWRVLVLGKESREAVLAEKGWKSRLKKVAELAGVRLACEGVGGVVAILVVYLAFSSLPGGPSRRIAQVSDAHFHAYEDSLAALDFRRARFHASQLQMLDPNGAKGERARGLALKADLIRTVLMRPGYLKDPGGVSDAVQLVQQVNFYLPNDPDVLTLQAYISWHTGGSRSAEYEAARLCTKAIDAVAKTKRRFALLPLAINYLEAYAFDPVPEDLTSQFHEALYPTEESSKESPRPEHVGLAQMLSSLAAGQELLDWGDPRLAPIKHVREYNAMVKQLLTKTTAAYFQMTEAHATYRYHIEKPLKAITDSAKAAEERKKLEAAAIIEIQPADPHPQRKETWNEAQKAKYNRYLHALEVLEAWRDFDRALQSSYWLAGTTASLSAFKLNDATYSRATWFVVNPNSEDLAKLLTPRSAAANRIPEKDKDGKPALDAKGNTIFTDRVTEEFKQETRLLVKTAPPRLAWRQRYSSVLGSAAGGLVNLEETKRFALFEQLARDFEHAMIGFVDAQLNGTPEAIMSSGTRAAKAAAALGFYYTESDAGQRRPYAKVILDRMRVKLSTPDQSAYDLKRVELERPIWELLKVRQNAFL